jgi:hypothetical protein
MAVTKCLYILQTAPWACTLYMYHCSSINIKAFIYIVFYTITVRGYCSQLLLQQFGSNGIRLGGILSLSTSSSRTAACTQPASIPHQDNAVIVLIHDHSATGEKAKQAISWHVLITMPVVLIHCPYSKPHPPQMGRV